MSEAEHPTWPPLSELRQRAERSLPPPARGRGQPSAAEIEQLLHELEVHRVELEMQNDELRRAQEELEASRDRYADLYDFAPLGYATIDWRGQITEINLTAAKVLGVERGKLIGHRLSSFIAREDRHAYHQHLAECGRNAHSHSAQLHLHPRTGQPIPVQLDSVATWTSGGEHLQYRIAITDIRRLADAERCLQELNASLEERVCQATEQSECRAASLRRLAAELSRTEQRERRRMAQLLHDEHQQILYAVRLRITAMRRKEDRPELASFYEEIDALLGEAIHSSRELIQQLCPPILQDAGLAAALDWLARQFEEKHRLPVRVAATAAANPENDETARLLFDATRELLFNVVKHARAASAAVSMRLNESGEIELDVADQGIGFSQVERDQRPADSTGLGLFGLRERLEAIGGRLQIQAVPGQGTRVTLFAPRGLLAKDDLPGALAGIRDVDEPAARGAADGGDHEPNVIHILVVDDHVILRDGLIGMLADEPDLKVVAEAADGEEAVAKAREHRPDLILMDVSLPKLSGVEATRQIVSEMPSVRVIGLSMHLDQDMASAMRAAGAVAYVSKSEPMPALLTSIRRCSAPAE